MLKLFDPEERAVTDPEIRMMLLEGLSSSGVHTLRDKRWSDGFLNGTRDVAFSEIEMDSLATMELCIAIEVNAGVSVLPDELRSMYGLSDLVARISAVLSD